MWRLVVAVVLGRLGKQAQGAACTLETGQGRAPPRQTVTSGRRRDAEVPPGRDRWRARGVVASGHVRERVTLVDTIVRASRGGRQVSTYAHRSLALGGFNSLRSDVDVLVVVGDDPPLGATSSSDTSFDEHCRRTGPEAAERGPGAVGRAGAAALSSGLGRESLGVGGVGWEFVCLPMS